MLCFAKTKEEEEKPRDLPVTVKLSKLTYSVDQ